MKRKVANKKEGLKSKKLDWSKLIKPSPKNEQKIRGHGVFQTILK